MATEENTERFYFEKCEVSEGSDEEGDYDWVNEDAGGSSLDDYEDLDKMVRKLQESAREKEVELVTEEKPKLSVTYKPELPEDFVRNYLMAMGMQTTLDAFQQECFLMQEKGVMRPSDFEGVDDLYEWNLHLSTSLLRKEKQLQSSTDLLARCKERLQKALKQRDFHMMQHRRVAQEKDRLRVEMRRLQASYAGIEPALATLTGKYSQAMREQYLVKRKLDQTQQELMTHIIRRYSSLPKIPSRLPISNINKNNKNDTNNTDKNDDGNNNQNINNEEVTYNEDICFDTTTELRRNNVNNNNNNSNTKTNKNTNNNNNTYNNSNNKNKNNINNKNNGNSSAVRMDSKFLRDTRFNRQLTMVHLPCPFLLRREGFQLAETLQAHEQTVTSVKVHGDTMATASDDMTWKLWRLPSMQLLHHGRGHLDWISDCDIDPSGSRLATVSGDTTLRIWSLDTATCMHSFVKHRKAVWGVSWNHGGDFVATCSLDNTAKLWDLNSLRCRFTLRGHKDSVNSVAFLPHSSILVTSSSDQTVCIWDARSNLCGGVYKGHKHSVNSSQFSLKGNLIVSCDSGGFMVVWDVRQKKMLTQMLFAPQPLLATPGSQINVKKGAAEVCCNQCSFDPTGSVVAVACSDSILRMVDLNLQKVHSMQGHEDSVQCLHYDVTGEYVLSGASDCSVRMWK